jgi:hypothetical protein
MVTNRFGRFFLVLAFVGLFPLAALAEEVVHFTNGAEMTVKSHTIENDKSMVKVDLGGNSYISFPMAMVDKIVNAGRDVFLNPGFHPSNQAIAGGSANIVADTTVRGIQGGQGLVPQPDGKGHAGTMLGEAADQVSGAAAPMGALTNDSMADKRRRFNPQRQMNTTGQPQLIMPPGMAQPTRAPAQLTVIGAPHAAEQQIPAPPPPAANNPPPENPPAEEPAPEDPPDTP